MTLTLIQIEVGSGVARRSVTPDNRGFLQKLFSPAPPLAANPLIEGTRRLRESLVQEEGWLLPKVRYSMNPELQPNEVVFHAPTGSCRCLVSGLNDVFINLRQVARAYLGQAECVASSNPCSRKIESDPVAATAATDKPEICWSPSLAATV